MVVGPLGDTSMTMSFLSSFRIGQRTLYPEELREVLQSFALLENVGEGALKNLAEADWFGLPGGALLTVTAKMICAFPGRHWVPGVSSWPMRKASAAWSRMSLPERRWVRCL